MVDTIANAYIYTSLYEDLVDGDYSAVQDHFGFVIDSAISVYPEYQARENALLLKTSVGNSDELVLDAIKNLAIFRKKYPEKPPQINKEKNEAWSADAAEKKNNDGPRDLSYNSALEQQAYESDLNAYLLRQKIIQQYGAKTED